MPMNFNRRLQHYMIKSFKFSKSNVINPVPQCWVASHWLHLLVLLFSLGIFDLLEWWWFLFVPLMWTSPCSCKKCHNYFSNFFTWLISNFVRERIQVQDMHIKTDSPKPHTWGYYHEDEHKNSLYCMFCRTEGKWFRWFSILACFVSSYF